MTQFHQRVNLDEFTEDWESDLTVDEIAEKHRVAPSTITRAAQTLRLKPRSRKRKLKRTKNALYGGEWVIIRGVQRWVSFEDVG